MVYMFWDVSYVFHNMPTIKKFKRIRYLVYHKMLCVGVTRPQSLLCVQAVFRVVSPGCAQSRPMVCNKGQRV
jgi:hypothetical protein